MAYMADLSQNYGKYLPVIKLSPDKADEFKIGRDA